MSLVSDERAAGTHGRRRLVAGTAERTRAALALLAVAAACAVFFLHASRTPVDPGNGTAEELALDRAQQAIRARDADVLRTAASHVDLRLYGPQLLGAAASVGEPAAIRVLIDLGVDPDAEFPRGVTPLIASAMVGRTEAVKCLLAAGADPRRHLSTGDTALTMAEKSGYEETAAVLRAAGTVPASARRR
jgi:ankyrin repeat protein